LPALGLLPAVVLAAGCGAQGFLLGAQQGYLLSGYDVLALPNEQVDVRVSMLGGNYLQGQPGRTVRFFQGGQPYRTAVTGQDGVAAVPFQPAAAGDYSLKAEVEPLADGSALEPVEILVACRTADAPMVVVDLDKTLVASGFHVVMVGDPKPMDRSPEVMQRLAQRYTVVYLTHRPEHFGPKSRSWLRSHEYPQGPLLVSTTGEFIKGSQAFKTAAIERLRERFKALQVGIGDKIGDALAYHANGLRAFLIPPIPDDAKGDSLRQWAAELDQLPDEVQVVRNWNEIEQGVFGSARFPRSAMQAELRRRADALDQQERARRASR